MAIQCDITFACNQAEFNMVTKQLDRKGRYERCPRWWNFWMDDDCTVVWWWDTCTVCFEGPTNEAALKLMKRFRKILKEVRVEINS